MAFCRYCGKELVNGECDCAEWKAAKAAEAAAAKQPVKTDAAQNETSGMQPGPDTQGHPDAKDAAAEAAAAEKARIREEKIENAGKTAASITAATIGAFFVSLKTPVSAMHQEKSRENPWPAVILGCVQAILILIFTWAHIPVLNSFLSGLDRFKLGLLNAFFVIMAVAITTMITFFFEKGNESYLKIFSILCRGTVTGTACLIAAFITGLFSGDWALIFIGIAIISWFLQSAYAMDEIMDDGSRDRKFLAVFISDILVAALTGMILYGVISTRADAIVNAFMSM
jgi:hypothetical protein